MPPLDMIGGVLDGASTVAIVVLVGWAIFAGRLVTRRELDTRIADKVERLADKDKTIDALQEANRTLSRQADTLAEVGETMATVLREIQSLARERRGGGS